MGMMIPIWPGRGVYYNHQWSLGMRRYQGCAAVLQPSAHGPVPCYFLNIGCSLDRDRCQCDAYYYYYYYYSRPLHLT